MDLLTYILAKKYTDSKIIESNGVIVDSELSETSNNPVRNSAIAKKLKEIVSSIVKVDSTLSNEGEAADAKVVGEKLKEISPNVTTQDSGKYMRVTEEGKLAASEIKYLGDIM